MAATAKNTELKLVANRNKPLQLYAEQGRLRGTLSLRNASTRQASIKSIPIHTKDVRDSDNDELISLLRVRGRVPPNDESQVRVEYQINPHTAPGIYQAVLQLGDEQQAAEIIIAENAELEIEPDELILNLATKPALTQELLFSNTGNIDIQLGNKFVLPVQSDAMLESALQRGIASLTGESSKKEPELKDILQEMGRQLAGPMTLLWPKTTIKPGESKTLQVKIDLPDNLQPHSRYYAELELYTGSLNFEIYT